MGSAAYTGNMATRPLVSVYELTNDSKREFFVWIETDGGESCENRMGSLRPSHWGAGDHITSHLIESGLLRDSALAFLDLYIKNLGQFPGWKHGKA